MAAGASAQENGVGCVAAEKCPQPHPEPLESGGAQCEPGATPGALPGTIEISDKDYRSFCFPCHALEEIRDCNGGYWPVVAVSP